MKGLKTTVIGNKKLFCSNEVYEPREDSYLLAYSVKKEDVHLMVPLWRGRPDPTGKNPGMSSVFRGLTGLVSCGRLGLEAGRDLDIPRFILGS